MPNINPKQLITLLIAGQVNEFNNVNANDIRVTQEDIDIILGFCF